MSPCEVSGDAWATGGSSRRMLSTMWHVSTANTRCTWLVLFWNAWEAFHLCLLFLPNTKLSNTRILHRTQRETLDVHCQGLNKTHVKDVSLFRDSGDIVNISSWSSSGNRKSTYISVVPSRQLTWWQKLPEEGRKKPPCTHNRDVGETAGGREDEEEECSCKDASVALRQRAPCSPRRCPMLSNPIYSPTLPPPLLYLGLLETHGPAGASIKTQFSHGSRCFVLFFCCLIKCLPPQSERGSERPPV